MHNHLAFYPATCFLCDRPSVDSAENLIPLCRLCYDRIHTGDLTLTHDGDWLRLERGGLRFAIAILEGFGIYGYNLYTLVNAYAHSTHMRTTHKLQQWRLAARLRAWSRIVTPGTWAEDVGRLLDVAPSTVRNMVAAWDRLFPEDDMSEMPSAEQAAILALREERLAALPGPVVERLGRMPDAVQFIELAEQQVAERGGQYLGEQFNRDVEREQGREPKAKKVWIKAICPDCGHEWYGEATACRWGTEELI